MGSGMTVAGLAPQVIVGPGLAFGRTFSMSTVHDALPGVPIEILLVEDDPGDVLITREAFAEHKVSNRLTVCSDGAAALRFLRKQGAHAGAARPDIVLLDLNLPGVDGR